MTEEIVQYIRKWGGCATDAVLDPHTLLFTLPEKHGVIGYRPHDGCVIVYGDPICAPKDLAQFVSEFHKKCEEEKKAVIYITATEEFSKWALDSGACSSMVEYGEELVINPHDDPRARQGVNASLVRRKVRHAEKEGVVVTEHLQKDSKIEEAIEEVGIAWLRARQGFQVHISHVHLFTHRFGKRWFYARQGDHIIGSVTINRLEKNNGWLLNHLIHKPDAPHGTPEILVVTALDTLAKEGYSYTTFGGVAAPKVGEIRGLSPLSSMATRGIYKIVNKIFHLEGRKKFWEKFHPESRRSFLLFNKGTIGAKTLLGLMKALNISYKN